MSGSNMSLCILVILGLNVVSQTEGLRILKSSQADWGDSNCTKGLDALPGDLMSLSWYVYNGSDYEKSVRDRNVQTFNKEMDRHLTESLTLKKYTGQKALIHFDNVAKCWQVYENQQQGPRIKGFEDVGRMSMVNFETCIIADVFEGTSIQKHKDDKARIGEHRKIGKWLSPMLSVIERPERKEFIQKFCGNPTVTHHYAQAFEDHTTEELMKRYNDREQAVKKHDWDGLQLLKDPKCPNGFNSVTTGHSLGGVLAMMTSYCNNYFYYDLWQKSISNGVDWPDWVKRSLFYSEVHSFASLQDTEYGSLVDFGALVPGNWRLREKPVAISPYADLCWQGGRTFFGGNILNDPAPDTFCKQTFDPISSVRLTDTLGEAVKKQCFCPTKYTYGMDRELVMQGLHATPMPCLASPHEKFSTKCLECYEFEDQPNLIVHIARSQYICAVRAANQKLSREENEVCNFKFGLLKNMVAEKQKNATLPGGKCKPRGGPSTPGVLPWTS